jgi:hypothetical protein
LAVVFVFFLTIGGAFYFLYIPKFKRMSAIKAEMKLLDKTAPSKSLNGFKPPTESEKLEWIETEKQIVNMIPFIWEVNQPVEELLWLIKPSEIVDISYPPLGQAQGALQTQEKNETRKFKLSYSLVKISFYCQYKDLLRILQDINDFTWLIEIESLRLRRALPMVLVELVVRVYYWEES